MDINKLTIGEIKEIEKIIKGTYTSEDNPWKVGQKYFIRTVTMHLTGELVSITKQELELKDAAWIADSGRFHKAIADIKNCSEVEPFINNVIIGRGSIVDATTINAVITEVK